MWGWVIACGPSKECSLSDSISTTVEIVPPEPFGTMYLNIPGSRWHKQEALLREIKYQVIFPSLVNILMLFIQRTISSPMLWSTVTNCFIPNLAHASCKILIRSFGSKSSYYVRVWRPILYEGLKHLSFIWDAFDFTCANAYSATNKWPITYWATWQFLLKEMRGGHYISR